MVLIGIDPYPYHWDFKGLMVIIHDNTAIPICVAIMEKIIGTNLRGFIKNGIAKKHRNRDKKLVYFGGIIIGIFHGNILR